MKKFLQTCFRKPFVVFLAVSVVAAGLTFPACSGNVDSIADIYSAPVTEKIMRDEDFEDKGPAVFFLSLAKNETEGAQIIINAKKDITFDAELDGDLIDKDGNRIYRENVSIYACHYIETKVATANFPTGFYPDAIVPMANYARLGDNKIGKGNNQGIYLEVTADPLTPAGIYRGKVILTLDGQVSEVPVMAEVFDFALSDTTHQWSSFLIWTGFMQDMLFAGEFDNSEDMYKKYYEFLLDHRVASTYLPTYDYTNTASYVKVVKEYAAREDVPCYSLPYEPLYKEEYFGYVIDEDAFKELMRALILESTPELDLLKKAYIYVSYIDEPHSTTDYQRVKYVDDCIYRICDELLQEYDAAGYFDDKNTLRDSLINFRHVVTTSYSENTADYVNTFCPTWDKYGDAMYSYGASLRFAQGENQWWYSCNIPLNPYPTYHIDDNLTGTRLSGWMQKKNNIEGTLYWAVNIYKKYYNGVYGIRNVWEDPLAFPATGSNPGGNGDGFLLYPGEKYGVDGPIGTIRLSAIRDGVEDYEYLYRLEELIKSANALYGSAFTLDDIVSSVYDRLFAGMIYVNDGKAIEQARREIAQMIVALEKGESIINVTGINGSAGVATVEIYAPSDAVVQVGGETLTGGVAAGNGIKYVYNAPVHNADNSVLVSVSGEGYSVSASRLICGRTTGLADFNDSDINGNYSSSFSSVQDTVLSHNTDTAYVREGKGSLKVSLTPVENATYIRQLSVGFGGLQNLEKCRSLSTSVFNTSENPVLLYIRIVDDSNKVREVGNFIALPGEWTDVSINISSMSGVDSLSVKYIRFIFAEISEATGFEEQFDMYFDNIYFTEGVS